MLSKRLILKKNPYQAPRVDMVVDDPTEPSRRNTTLAPSTRKNTHQGVFDLCCGLFDSHSVSVCGDFGGKTTQTENAHQMRTLFVGCLAHGPGVLSTDRWRFGCWREDLRVVKMPGQKYTSGIDSCHQWWLGLQVYSFMRAFCKSRTTGS